MNKKKSNLSSRDSSGLFDIIKNSKKNNDLSLEQLLSVILNRQISKRQAKMYLDETYGTNKIDWLNMSHLQIYELGLKVVQYKKDKQQKQRQERIKKQNQKIKQQQQQKKIEALRNEMISKNINKETMITQVKQSIKKLQQKMSSCKDQKQYQKLKQSINNQQQSLAILQKTQFLDLEPQDQQKINQQQLRMIQEQKQRKRIEEQKLQDQRIEKEKRRQSQIKKNKKQINRKLSLIFQYYGKHGIERKDTFQDKNKSDKEIDLKGLLHYIRQFQILNDEFQVYDILNCFKKLSKNGMWLNYSKFQQLMYEIAQIRYKKMNNIEGIQQNYIQFLNEYATNNERINKYLNINKKQKQKKNEFKFYVHSGKMKQDIIEEIRTRRLNTQLKKINLKQRSLSKNQIRYKEIVPLQKKRSFHKLQKKYQSQSRLIYKSFEELKDLQPELNVLKKIGYFDQQPTNTQNDYRKTTLRQLINQKKKGLLLPPIRNPNK